MRTALLAVMLVALTDFPTHAGAIGLDTPELWQQQSVVLGKVVRVMHPQPPRPLLVPLTAEYEPLHLVVGFTPISTIAGTFDAGIARTISVCMRFDRRADHDDPLPVQEGDAIVSLVPTNWKQTEIPVYDRSVAFFPRQVSRARPPLFRLSLLGPRTLGEFADDLREQRRLARHNDEFYPDTASADTSYWKTHGLLVAHMQQGTSVPVREGTSITVVPLLALRGSFDPTAVSSIRLQVPEGVTWPALQRGRRQPPEAARDTTALVEENANLRLILFEKRNGHYLLPTNDNRMPDGNATPTVACSPLTMERLMKLAAQIQGR